MAPRLHHILALVCLMTLSSAALGQKDRDRERDRQRAEEAQRRQLDTLRREVRELEQTVKQVEKEIDSRKQQLADAPKTIKPAEKTLKEAEQRHEKAQNVMPDLRKQVEEADGTMAATLRALKSEFDGAKQLDAAEEKLAAAQQRLEEAREAGVQKLSKNESYQMARERVRLAKARVDVLNERVQEGGVPPSEIVDANSLLLQFQRQLDAMEAKVLTDDERYREARKEVEEQEKTIVYLRGQMVEKVKTHPEYVAAEKQLAAVRERFGAATREVIEASKARAEAAGTLSRLNAQVKEFERDTERLKSRREALQTQLRAKERRAENYARDIRR